MASFPSIPGFSINKLLGQGGTAVVYRALDDHSGEAVAIKLMARKFVDDVVFKQRFLREGQVAQGLDHPHIIPVYQCGETARGQLFFVMALAANGDLRARIRDKIAPVILIDVVRKIAGALQYLHEKGLVHRDIKPANILFSADNTPMLADFGISKSIDTMESLPAVEGTMIGTPEYMSPEQIKDRPLDGRSDQYSLGVMLYEILEGRRPFGQRDVRALALMHIRMRVPALSAHYRNVQPIIERLLRKSPQKRYPDCATLVSVLDRLLSRSDGTLAFRADDIPSSRDELASRWHARRLEDRSSPEAYLELGRQAIKMYHPVLATEILGVGLAMYANHSGLLLGLAHASLLCRSFLQARELAGKLRELVEDGDPIVVRARHLAGDIGRACWTRMAEGPEKIETGEIAYSDYCRAWELGDDRRAGISAASLGMLLGLPGAVSIARQLRLRCEQDLSRSEAPDFALFSALGEVSLVAGDQDEATKYYVRALECAISDAGNTHILRRQVNMIASHLPVSVEINALFGGHRVAAFSGHILDTDNQSPSRFPAYLESHVREVLRERILALDIKIGYCSLACGSEILFAEAMQAIDAELHVILPFERNAFVQAQVAIAGADWVGRFDRILQNASSVSYATEESSLDDDGLSSFALSLLQGSAILTAQQLAVEPVMLTVLEPDLETEDGWTMQSTHLWQDSIHPIELIDLQQIRQATPVPEITAPDHCGTEDVELVEAQHATQQPSLGTDFFEKETEPDADIPGPVHADEDQFTIIDRGPPPRNDERCEIGSMIYVSLEDGQQLEKTVPNALYFFLTEMVAFIKANDKAPLYRNSLDNGLFLVFEEPENAANFALELHDAMEDVDWPQYGFPEQVDIRISLHCGPISSSADPITGDRDYYGTQVDYLSQMVKNSVPNSVCMSEQAAAMLVNLGRFSRDSFGEMALASGKNLRLYRLRRFSQLC